MPNSNQNIISVTPRDDVYITLPNDIILAAPVNTRIEALLNTAIDRDLLASPAQLIAAIHDGHLRELSHRLQHDGHLRPVTLAESDGGRIYRRSLVLLMVTAATELWPDIVINVDHAVPDGGFFCQVENRAPLTQDELAQLNAHMHAIVTEDSPITKRDIGLAESIKHFQEKGLEDKVRLFQNQTETRIALYTLRQQENYFFGYMLPSTRYLTLFNLIYSNDGFILQYPRTQDPTQLFPMKNYDKIKSVFQRTGRWLERLAIEDIGRLNTRIHDDQIREVILVAEALHEQHVANIATQIRQQHDEGVRIILIAGPSSSGKTTFAKRLAIQLLAHGIRPFTIEMDNYFVNRENTPRDENGDYDFESINALHRHLLNDHLLKLMYGEEVQLPKFNFITGQREAGRLARLDDRQIMILEGIHGLNPDLVPEIPTESIFRIYVSALTQLNIDSHNRIPTTDVRLLRRIVRDARTRGYNATETLQRWKSVRRGEKQNIFPYQENANVMFNSAMPYELAALRPLAEPLLRQVEFGTPAYTEARRLLSFLRWVHPLRPEQTEVIPATSLLREFIGGSILDSYHPGGTHK